MISVDLLVHNLAVLGGFVLLVLMVIWTEGLYDLSEAGQRLFVDGSLTGWSSSLAMQMAPELCGFVGLKGVTLLCYLITACGGCWILEQPSGSLMEYYPTWRHLLVALFQVDGMGAESSPVRHTFGADRLLCVFPHASHSGKPAICHELN
ncbi:unnamed protein product [Symbiodinium sp. CCMP2592]|nr:unnamed protein product [Symbiodinium sp. CCMP2592]